MAKLWEITAKIKFKQNTTSNSRFESYTFPSNQYRILRYAI
jgi:hypothetical protein